MKLDTCSAVIIHIFTCKDCREVLKDHFAKELAGKAGSTKSPAKARASRANGMKGGRPRKHNAATREKMRLAWAKRKAKKDSGDPEDGENRRKYELEE